ncbi:hypothetical protein JW968_06310 [Candidatus Woesearchaeota archaeon]|nr:hypothetical protein [Candidatus Woesearchaeota archaeon]
MVFVKSFPKTTEGSSYPKWVEITLSDEEEREIERKATQVHYAMMKQCLDDAEKIMKERGMEKEQEDAIPIAGLLFDKRASHTVFYKEEKCREKFDKG